MKKFINPLICGTVGFLLADAGISVLDHWQGALILVLCAINGVGWTFKLGE